MKLLRLMLKSMVIYAIFNLLFGCGKLTEQTAEFSNNLTKTTVQMEDLVVPQSFSWKTTQEVSLSIKLEGQNGNIRRSITIYYTDLNNKSVKCKKGFFATNNEFERKIIIPAYIDALRIKVSSKIIEKTINDGKIQETIRI
jgi:hypothetical protein